MYGNVIIDWESTRSCPLHTSLPTCHQYQCHSDYRHVVLCVYKGIVTLYQVLCTGTLPYVSNTLYQPLLTHIPGSLQSTLDMHLGYKLLPSLGQILGQFLVDNTFMDHYRTQTLLFSNKTNPLYSRSGQEHPQGYSLICTGCCRWIKTR